MIEQVFAPLRIILGVHMGCIARVFAVKIAPLIVIDGVKVKRIPLLKYKLHGAFPETEIESAYQKTCNYIEREKFRPDCIVSHWVNPQLEVMQKLKERYRVTTCYVAHTAKTELLKTYDYDRACQLIGNIDLIGFRSQYIKDVFLSEFDFNKPTFQCYSGIPEHYMPKMPVKRSFDSVRSLLFVGTLIKRKYPAEIIPAAVQAFDGDEFEITYIGSGDEDRAVRRSAKSFCVTDKVLLLGRKSRDEVIEYMQRSDVFVMASRSEAFGLVYLEAMAQGCLTIASRREGFDGIIQDGVNGFLCDAGDIDDLAATLKKIKELPKEELARISAKAVETARNLTDTKVADSYYKELAQISHNQAIV